ncbi:hypothetical protein QJS10_CPA06g01370 [Acorus calamus]|uniref:Uncharacterized protein n=1 Tax=Acorus calamus TaxID=4465 RepID=A0AAV9EPS5_ACOCL|nr:hypothetical protein QJS10_CPA06g01370 [Acorus calamus]
MKPDQGRIRNNDPPIRVSFIGHLRALAPIPTLWVHVDGPDGVTGPRGKASSYSNGCDCLERLPGLPIFNGRRADDVVNNGSSNNSSIKAHDVLERAIRPKYGLYETEEQQGLVDMNKPPEMMISGNMTAGRIRFILLKNIIFYVQAV